MPSCDFILYCDRFKKNSGGCDMKTVDFTEEKITKVSGKNSRLPLSKSKILMWETVLCWAIFRPNIL